MKISEIRKTGENIDRKGMSKLAKFYVNEFDGSYKGVMELCGKLSVIAKMATCDVYWNEKTKRGIHIVEWFCGMSEEHQRSVIDKMAD